MNLTSRPAGSNDRLAPCIQHDHRNISSTEGFNRADYGDVKRVDPRILFLSISPGIVDGVISCELGASTPLEAGRSPRPPLRECERHNIATPCLPQSGPDFRQCPAGADDIVDKEQRCVSD